MQFLGPCPNPVNPNLFNPSDSVKFSKSNFSGFSKQSSFLGTRLIFNPFGIVIFVSGIL